MIKRKNIFKSRNNIKTREKNLVFVYSKPRKKHNSFIQNGINWHLNIRSKFGPRSNKFYLFEKQAYKTRSEMRWKYRQLKFKLLLRQTTNNFFTTLLRAKRKVVWGLSCGIIGLKGPQRSTPFGAEQVGRFSLKKMRRAKRRRTLLVIRSAVTAHMKACLAVIKKSRLFRALLDLIPRPHNGLRHKKLRRV
jgi:small subunit ribosomal protein S11